MNIGKKLVDALRAKTKPSAYDTSAVVKRIEGQTAWVSISGGVDETPVKISIDAKPGDNVNVRVAGGKAWITGNNTAPPTDDKTAKAAMNATKKTSKSLKNIEDKIENGDFDGTSVNGVTAQYCLANANAIPAGQTFDDIQYSAWQDTIPEYVEGKYYWMRLKIVYSDGTVGYNAPVFDLGTQASIEADIAAAAAASAASDAEEIAQQALTGVGNIENHFWADSSGVHVSESDGSVASGASQTISSNGTVMMRNGRLVTSWTGSGPGDAAINFYDCTYGSARTSDLVASYGRAGIIQYINNVVAMALTASGLSFYTPDTGHKLQAVFGSTGVELYASGVKRMVVTSSGMTIYAEDGVTKMAEYNSGGLSVFSGVANGPEIAHFGYDYGKDSSGSTSNKVIYSTLGTRKVNSVIGEKSVSEGSTTTASAYCSHAEGNNTEATDKQAHAEGLNTQANGPSSHAEGEHTLASGRSSHAEGQGLYSGSTQDYTTASGAISHAEGASTTASGAYSHSQNIGTIADKDGQTAMGTYNVADTTPSAAVNPNGKSYGNYALIIGNGTPTARSNAFGFKWNGDLKIKGDLYFGCNGDSSGGKTIFDAIYPVGSIYMSVNNTNPGTLFGGTWIQLQDRFLLGAGTSYTAGNTGGEATVTLTAAQSGLRAHTHSFTQPSVDVNLQLAKDAAAGTSKNRVTSQNAQSPDAHTTYTQTAAGGAVGAVTGGAKDATSAHNNMPPYLVVYMWKRTA